MNHIELKFSANLKNESFARVAVSAFASELDPTIDELLEIKTIISEAVSNAIIHGYKMDEQRDVYIRAKIVDRVLEMEVIDYGCGIENIDEILNKNYSIDCDNEHSGMGLTIMKSLSSFFEIHSTKNLGTRIVVKKEIAVNTIKDESKAVQYYGYLQENYERIYECNRWQTRKGVFVMDVSDYRIGINSGEKYLYYVYDSGEVNENISEIYCYLYHDMVVTICFGGSKKDKLYHQYEKFMKQMQFEGIDDIVLEPVEIVD